MVPTRLWRCASIASLVFLAACGGGDSGNATQDVSVPGPATIGDDDSAEGTDSVQATVEAGSATAPDTSDAAEASTDDQAVGQSCALLDEMFLNETFDGQTGMFGEPYQFEAGSPSPTGLTCTWDDGSTGLSLRVSLEDAASSETEDHSGRAYNIDVEPDVEPQDGPGEKAVLLVDGAFDDLGGDGFAYGYFFVQGDVAVFVETVGLDIGAEGLRTLADEASARLVAR